MRQITTTSGTRVTIGSNAEASIFDQGAEALTNFLLILDDAIASTGRSWFIANGTHYSLNRLHEVNEEPSGPFRAPRWNPKGTAVTWSDEPHDGIPFGTGTATGIYEVSGPFSSGPTYYQVIREDGQTFWVQYPTRRH